MFSIKRLKNHDYIITICIFLLSILSLVLIYSTTYNSKDLQGGAGTFKKQIVFFIVGFILYFVLSNFDISWLKNNRILIILYLITIGFLVYVKFFTPEIASTNRWITLFGYSIQPAEYSKIALTIIIASIFSQEKDPFLKVLSISKSKKNKASGKKRKLRKFISLFLTRTQSSHRYILSMIAAIPIVALVFIQPAFGNSVIIICLFLVLLFAATSNQLKVANFIIPFFLVPALQWNIIKMSHPVYLFIIIGLILSMFIFSFRSKLKWYLVIFAIVFSFLIKPATMTVWNSGVLSNYQRERFETFFQSPEKDPLNAGYQVRQSKIAIGAGRLFGRGYLKGTQSTLKVLPFAHTDFIFASLGEQFGLVGALLLILIYMVLIIRMVLTAQNAKDEFSFLIVVGCCVIFILNIFINIGMNMGKLPVTGVPLPLVSYGGSSVIVNLTGLGLIQATRRHLNIKDVSESLTPNNNPWT